MYITVVGVPLLWAVVRLALHSGPGPSKTSKNRNSKKENSTYFQKLHWICDSEHFLFLTYLNSYAHKKVFNQTKFKITLGNTSYYSFIVFMWVWFWDVQELYHLYWSSRLCLYLWRCVHTKKWINSETVKYLDGASKKNCMGIGESLTTYILVVLCCYSCSHAVFLLCDCFHKQLG